MSMFDSRFRRRSVAVAASLVGLIALAACNNNATSDNAAGGKPQQGGTLKVSFFPDNPTFPCMDPFQVYWIESRTIIRNFADSLTDQDPKTGKIVPWLAKSWDISKNGLTYTFHLRSGVTFSNGKPLNAQAVAADAKGWIKTVGQTDGAAYGSSYIQGLTGAKALNASTVRFSLDQPNSSFLQATSTTNLAITDPSEYAETPAQRCTGKGLVGSGLFRFDKYTPGVQTVISRRKGYHWASSLVKNQGAAYLDKVIFNYVSEDSVRTGNLVSGAIDIDWPRNPFSPQDEALITRSGDTIEKRALPGVSYTQFANVSKGHVLADPQVRKALYKAVDVKSYAHTVFGKDYPVVQGAYDSTTPDFKSEASKLAYDPSGAEAILQADGWKVGSGGYRYKDGKELSIEYPQTQFSEGAVLVQAQLKKVGINLTLPTLTPAEQATYIPNGQYDWTNDYFTRADPGALQFILNPSVANIKALAADSASPSVTKHIEALFSKAIHTTDAAQTKAAYGELQDYLINEGVTFPLFERVQEAGVNSDVHGFAFTSESFLRLNDVWKS